MERVRNDGERRHVDESNSFEVAHSSRGKSQRTSPPARLLRGPGITGEIRCDVCIPLANLPVDSFEARVPEASAWKSNYFPLRFVASSSNSGYSRGNEPAGLAYICARRPWPSQSVVYSRLVAEGQFVAPK